MQLRAQLPRPDALRRGRLRCKVALVVPLAALVLFAFPGTAGAATTFISKTADESVTSSSTLQNDDELSFTTTNGTSYGIEIVLNYVSAAGGGTPDLKFSPQEDGSPNLRGTCFTAYYNASDAAATQTFATNGTSSGTAGTATQKRTLWIHCGHTGGGGTFNVKWAQGTSDSNATTVLTGSYMAVTTSGSGSVAWADITGKPNFETTYCNADGTEADSDCLWAPAGSTGALSESEHDSLNLIWYGVWAIVGLLLVLLIAPYWWRAWGFEEKLGPS